MKNFRTILILLILLAYSPSVLAGDFDLDQPFEHWSLSPLNNLSVIPSDPNGVLGLDDDLISETESRPNGRLIFEFPRYFPNLYVMATSIEFEGNDSKDLRFNTEDKIITGKSFFDSQITMNELDLALYYDVPIVSTLSSDRINIDLGLNVRAIDFDGKIEQDYIDNGSKNFVVPIPMVFGALKLQPMNKLALEAEGRGLSVGANKAFSVVGRIRWNVMDHMFATGGYRFDKVDVNYQGILIDANISGPFFEAGLSF